METVLVTGAAGTTGSALVRQLSDYDVTVRAALHSRGSGGDLTDTADEVVEIDMNDPGTLSPAFEGVDRIYLLTPSLADQTPQVENLVDAAVTADVKHIVRHSALGAGTADPPYSLAANHNTAEDIVAEAGIATTFVRPTAFMQNLLNDAESVHEQSAIYSPVGHPVAYVDARDVAAVAATVLTGESHDGEAYPVTGPEAITHADIVAALSKELGRDIKHVQVGMDDAREGMLNAGMPEDLADGLVGLLEWFEAGGGANVYSTVEDLTGSPSRSIDTFVADYAGEFGA
jgi:uncharacterized protein YbjT (DUF2867 family)